MTRSEQRDIATKLLNNLFTIDTFAMIAGGAPRDWYLGDTARDLDVYLRMPNHDTMGKVVDVCTQLGMVDVKAMERSTKSNECEFAYSQLPNLKWVFEGKFAGVPVNIMVMEEGKREEIVKDFDLGICKVWFDGEKSYYTEEFMMAVQNNICLVHPKYKGTEMHIRKMKSRFPNLIFCKKLEIQGLEQLGCEGTLGVQDYFGEYPPL